MLNEQLFWLAKKYDIPESSIDESIIPILLALEKNQLLTQQLLQQVQTNIKPVVYSNISPKSALMLRWGWGVWLMPLILVAVMTGYFWSRQHNELSRLQTVVERDPKTGMYFIRTQNYVVVPSKKNRPGGIVLKVGK